MAGNPVSRNVMLSLLAGLVAVVVGIYGYTFPAPVVEVAGVVVTSVSIIFALSLSLITIASSRTEVSQSVVPRKQTRREIEGDIEAENDMTILKQQFAVFIFVLTAVVGIGLIASSTHAPCSSVVSAISGVFALLTTVSFTIALVLPFSISRILRRDREFRSLR